MATDFSLFKQEIDNNLSALPEQVSRVFHGRGRFFPALDNINVEWYPPVLFVQCYEEALDPDCKTALKAVFEANAMIETVLLQSRPWPDVENEILFTRHASQQQLPLEFDASLGNGLKCKVSLGA